MNLHHAKGASGILCRRFTKENINVAMLQEPWVNKNKVSGLTTNSGKLLYDDSELAPRAAILVSANTNFTPITEFIKRDIVAIQIELPTTRGKTEILVASAYFPGELDEAPPQEVEQFITHCKRNNKQFIIGCDANAHHTVWGSTDINKRGECLFEYILSNNIDICNRGNNPTFVNAIRQEVLDLTLASTKLSDNIENWHVSEEISLSDHSQILFEYNAGTLLTEVYRDPKTTNWELFYSKILRDESTFKGKIKSVRELEDSSRVFSNKIIALYNESCPVKKRTSNKDVPWWNKKLEKLRKSTRRLFNRAKLTSDWDTYRESLTEYNREIRKSRRRGWRFMCERIENTPTVARLQKALSKDHTNGLGRIKQSDGTFTTDSLETLNEMMEKHFPGSQTIHDGEIQDSNDVNTGSIVAITNAHRQTCNIQDAMDASNSSIDGRENAHQIACNIFTESKVEWAINSFEPYKSPGVDGILPIMLQQSKKVIIPFMTEIFRYSLIYNYIPTSWRKTRVIFIPKAGKRDKTSP